MRNSSYNFYEDEHRYEMEQMRQAHEYEMRRQDEENQMRYEVHLIELKQLEIKEMVLLMEGTLNLLYEKKDEKLVSRSFDHQIG